MPKIVAVVGGKHSGKTTVIEHLIAELKHRGYRVGTIKEMVRIPTLDTPATETDRYTSAGAEIVVAVPLDETVVFIRKRLSIKEILPYLKGMDYVILEGFETEAAVPKVLAAKTADEVKSYFDSSVIAVSGLLSESKTENKKHSIEAPSFKIMTEAKGLADLVEKKAVELDY
jgi:molybdopterin-guanine dinucleotide biosynthesis protein B